MINITELISYYYNFENIDITKEENKYIFNYNDNIYVLSPLIRDKSEIFEIYSFLNNTKAVDKIIKNRFDDIITNIYGKDYILIKRHNNLAEKLSFDAILEKNGNKIMINNSIGKLDHSDWDVLWSAKIDYIEYQIKHIENKYPILAECIDYYIGMAENAICYFKSIFERHTRYEQKVMSHIRINDCNFNDPQNIIIDYPSRDIAEYLKYIFFNKPKFTSSTNDIKSIFNKITSGDGIELELVYARLLFPTFFFDSCDMIINGNTNESIILSLVNRADEYEDYLKTIYDVINLQKKIPRITWI